MKIKMAQINTTVGDLAGNADKIIDIIHKSKGNADLVVFPELSITGYPPLDLIERPGFCQEQIDQLLRIADATSYNGVSAVVGCFYQNTSGVGKPFYNALVLVADGEIKTRYRKRLLPTYNIFDESRHFEPGTEVNVFQHKGVKLGFLICEDMWNDKAITEDHALYANNPVKETVDAGAEIIISINSSPSNVGKPEYRAEKFAKIAENYKTPIIYVNQVGGNDDLVFDGTSFAINAEGEVLDVLTSFEEQQQTFEAKKIGEKLVMGYVDEPQERHTKRWVRDQIWKMKPAEFYFRQIVLGIKDYARKIGFKKAVIACSGGVDSALVLALAVEALGRENVEAITMPSKVSSAGSVDDSVTLCKNLGVKLYTYPIAEGVAEMMRGFDTAFGRSEKSLTVENLQARLRGMILMGFSNEHPEFLPLTTGNKSECAVGYCTIYGDMNGGLAPISDLYKTEVWDVCRYINKYHNKEIIPNVIIDKEPSAELYEGQKDTNSLPAYPVLDAVLIPFIEGNAIDPNILKACEKTVAEAGFTDFAKIHRMVDRSEFKRRQAAPTIRVHQKAWGAGRRMPIAQNHKPSNVLA